MNRKVFSVVSVLLIWGGLASGCGSRPELSKDNKTIEGGIIINEDESGGLYSMDTIPFNCRYNENTITVADIKCFENEQDYEYYGYVVVTLDISGLDDKTKHWLYEDEDLDVSAMFEKGKNNFEYEHLKTSKPVEHDGKLYYLLRAKSHGHGYKESFVGTEVSIHVRVVQNETYKTTTKGGKELTPRKEDTYIYAEEISDDIGSLEDLVMYLGDVLDIIDE